MWRCPRFLLALLAGGRATRAGEQGEKEPWAPPHPFRRRAMPAPSAARWISPALTAGDSAGVGSRHPRWGLEIGPEVAGLWANTSSRPRAPTLYSARRRVARGGGSHRDGALRLSLIHI